MIIFGVIITLDSMETRETTKVEIQWINFDKKKIIFGVIISSDSSVYG